MSRHSWKLAYDEICSDYPYDRYEWLDICKILTFYLPEEHIDLFILRLFAVKTTQDIIVVAPDKLTHDYVEKKYLNQIRSYSRAPIVLLEPTEALKYLMQPIPRILGNRTAVSTEARQLSHLQ